MGLFMFGYDLTGGYEDLDVSKERVIYPSLRVLITPQGLTPPLSIPYKAKGIIFQDGKVVIIMPRNAK